MTLSAKDQSRLQAMKNIVHHVAEVIDAKFSIQLWDGSMIPLGQNPEPGYYLSISGPGVMGSLMRKPTLENFLSLYALGYIQFHGGDMMAFGDVVRSNREKRKHRRIKKSVLFKNAWPLLMTPADQVDVEHSYTSDETGRVQNQRDNKEFIQFHYDVSNEFYQLFLDPEMQYSCGYFQSWERSLEQAQVDKLDMICRKLRLQPGERLLDIGCGWGGLICHAAKNYGVDVLGVTLSQKQYDFAVAKVKRLGLEKQVTVELRDYITVDGQFDKISSIGMFEHIGIKNFPEYFGKIHSLLRDRGIMLNHGIARRAKKNKKKFKRIRQSHRWILKHIFPGSELDHIGHTLEVIESHGFEIHDVEAWREHYARTSRLWCERLYARREEAIKLVGIEKFRLWQAYLTGVAFSFADGPLCIYQVIATKHRKGASLMPPTRADLYR